MEKKVDEQPMKGCEEITYFVKMVNKNTRLSRVKQRNMYKQVIEHETVVRYIYIQ